MYGYAILSRTFYAVRYKRIKKDTIDPIIINLVYFLFLALEVYCKKIDDALIYIIFILITPIISFLYLKYNKIELYVKSYTRIASKTIFFGILAFFIINSQHVNNTFSLIGNDLYERFKNIATEVYGEQKEKVISNLLKKINDNNLSKKQIQIYTKNDETIIVIKDKIETHSTR